MIERPEPPVSPAQTQTELAAYRRQQARQRCTLVLRLLVGVAITTGIMGVLPAFRLAWIFTGITGIAALALAGLIAYAAKSRASGGSPRPRTIGLWGSGGRGLHGRRRARCVQRRRPSRASPGHGTRMRTKPSTTPISHSNVGTPPGADCTSATSEDRAFTEPRLDWLTCSLVGGVAQLAERYVRNVEAVGSNPITSTKKAQVTGLTVESP